jgi:hypothetical protein
MIPMSTARPKAWALSGEGNLSEEHVRALLSGWG